MSEIIEIYLEICRGSEGHTKDTLKTRKCRLYQMSRYFSDRGIHYISQISTLMLSEFFTDYSCNRAVSTTNATKLAIKAFLRYAEAVFEVSVSARLDVIRQARVPKSSPRALHPEIVQKVIREGENMQDRIMVAFIEESGVRLAELVNIRVEHVHFDQIWIARGKGGDPRWVSITDKLATWIKMYLESVNHEYLFEHQHPGWYGKMTVGTARKRIQAIFLFVTGMHVYPHQLRHTMAVEALLSGIDLVTIQKQLGHKHLSTTQIYLDVLDERRKIQYKTHMVSLI